MPELRLRGGEVDGLDLHYLVEGRGPAVVLVHGLGGFAESWRHTLRGLAARTTVYALDLPGFGASAKPRTRYRLPYFAGALHGFMEALGIQGASLVGHSLGAAVAVTYAVTHPARVERLALVGGVVPGFGYRPSWVYRLVALPLIGEALARCGSAAPHKTPPPRCLPPPRPRAGRDREPLARGLPGRAARASLSGDRHGRHHAARPESATGPERPAPPARRAPGLGDAALPPRQLGAHPDRGDRGQGGRAQFRRRDRRLLPSGRAERGGRRLPAPARLQEREEPRRGPRSLGADGRPDHAPVLSVGLLPRAAPGSPFGATPLGPLRARSKPGKRLVADAGLHLEPAGVAVWCTLDRPPLNLPDPRGIPALGPAFAAFAADRAPRVGGLTR